MRFFTVVLADRTDSLVDKPLVQTFLMKEMASSTINLNAFLMNFEWFLADHADVSAVKLVFYFGDWFVLLCCFFCNDYI